MTRHLLLAATVAVLALEASAERHQPIPGDENFLADAYADAENGTSFSYARVWGERRAYDGTDTSQFYPDAAKAQPQATASAPTARTEYVTRPGRETDARAESAPAEQAQPPKIKLRGLQRH